MSPKAAKPQADAKASPVETPAIHTGSDNVSYISCLNPIQTRGWWPGWDDCGANEREVIEANFWRRVKPAAGSACWLYDGPKVRGYGVYAYRVGGRTYRVYAHRFRILISGSISDGLVACHVCDVPLCVNRLHLFVGTQGDNLRDAARKGRLTVPRTKKLTLADRLAIQGSTEPGVLLAARYGVTATCISLTRRGRFVGSGTTFRPERPRLDQHDPEAVLERVPCVQLPIRGEVA